MLAQSKHFLLIYTAYSSKASLCRTAHKNSSCSALHSLDLWCPLLEVQEAKYRVRDNMLTRFVFGKRLLDGALEASMGFMGCMLVPEKTMMIHVHT